jgi:hypothetical protein
MFCWIIANAVPQIFAELAGSMLPGIHWASDFPTGDVFDADSLHEGVKKIAYCRLRAHRRGQRRLEEFPRRTI